VDSRTLKNWRVIEKALRDAGKTDCMFYHRAVSILGKGRDLLDEPLNRSGMQTGHVPTGGTAKLNQEALRTDCD